MFYGCSSLNYLPDFTKWNKKNIINIKGIFKGCSLFFDFPDISKLDNIKINNEKDINEILDETLSMKDSLNNINTNSSKDKKDEIISSESSFLSINNKEEFKDIYLLEKNIEEIFKEKSEDLKDYYDNFYN